MPRYVEIVDKDSSGFKDVSYINPQFECLKISVMQKLSKLKLSNNGQLKTSNYLFENDDEDESEKPSNDSKNITNRTPPKNDKQRKELSFSIKKLLLENENRRREDVRKTNEMRKKQMDDFELNLKKEKARMMGIMALKREQQRAADLARLEAEQAEEEQRVQQLELQQQQKQKLEMQRIRERMDNLEREQAEQLRKLEMQKRAANKIDRCSSNFSSACEGMNYLSMACKDRHAASEALAPHLNHVQELGYQLEMLKEKTRSGEISEDEIALLDAIMAKTTEINDKFRKEIESIDAASEIELAKREEACKQAESQLKEVTEKTLPGQIAAADQVDNAVQEQGTEQAQEATEAPSDDDVFKLGSQESWIILQQSQQLVKDCNESVQEFVSLESMKKFRVECQKAVSIPINALTGKSRENLVEKYQSIANLLSGKTHANILQYPPALAYCKQFLAKKILTQRENVGSRNAEMAFGIAALSVALWNDFPDFGDILLASFRDASCYLVPVVLPHHQKDQSEMNQDVNKIGGLMRMYAAITVTKQRRGVTKPHPHGLENAWRWLAAMLNIEPQANAAEVSVTLITVMLEVAGNALWASYPKQFPKMLQMLISAYLPRMKSLGVENASGPLGRLEIFLKDCIAKGSIPPPPKQLPPNFW